jgi:hypothetical protein
VVYVLLRHVRVVPAHLFLESPRRRIVFDLEDLGANDPFEPVKHGSGANPLERSRPLGSVAKTHRIVVAVGVSESHHQASRRLEAQRFNELLAQQSHGGCAQDDHPLLVESDDPLIGAEIEDLGEVEVLPMRRCGIRRLLHVSLSPILVIVMCLSTFIEHSPFPQRNVCKVRCAGNHVTRDGRREQHERADARGSCHRREVSHLQGSANQQASQAEGGGFGRGLHSREHVRHSQNPDRSEQGERRSRQP